MIYDEKRHYNLVFSEIQKVGYYNMDFSREYSQRKYEQIREVSGGKPLVLVNRLPETGICILGLALSALIGYGMHRLLPCGKQVIFHMIAAFAFAFAGWAMLHDDGYINEYCFFRDPLPHRLRSILYFAEAVAIPVMWFNLPFETDWMCSFFMAGVFFLVMAASVLIDYIARLTAGTRIFTRSIDATCIGYVRKRTTSTDADNHEHVHWYNSPVFKYFADGREIIAFYDILEGRIDSKLPLGPCTIRVNKDDPTSIMNPRVRGIISSVIVMLILTALGLFLLYSVLNGHVHGSGISA